LCLDQCVCAVWCSGVNCTGTEGTDEGNIMETGVMSQVERVGLVVSRSCVCAVWCSRVNCTGTEGIDEGNIIETGVMSQVERVGLVVPR